MSKAVLSVACASAILGYASCATADVILTPGTAIEASYDLDTQFPGNPVDQFGAGIGFGAQACRLALRSNTNCLIPPALLSARRKR